MNEPENPRFTRQEAASLVGEALADKTRSDETLSQAEVEAAASGVGLHAEAIRSVIARRDAEAQAKKARRTARWRTLRAFGGWTLLAAGTLTGILGISAGIDHDNLTTRYAAVQAARQNVAMVYSRRGLVPTLPEVYGDQALVAEATARAEHRIYIAKHDYDVTALTYNQLAAEWVPRALVLPHTALPAQVPYAAEVWGTR